jgi:amino acid transporter
MSFINMFIKRQDSDDSMAPQVEGTNVAGTPITYEPMMDSKTLAIVFTGLFAFATIFTFAKILRYKKDMKNPIGVVFFYLPAPIIEAVGFLVRIFAAANPDNNGLFIANMTLLGTAPLFLTMTSWVLFPVLSFHAGLEYSGKKFKPRRMLGPAIVVLISVFHLNIRGMQPPIDTASRG